MEQRAVTTDEHGPETGADHHRIEHDSAHPVPPSSWATRMVELVGDPLLSDDTLEALRREIADGNRDTTERIVLRDELEYIGMLNGWESTIGEAVEYVLDALDDRIYDDLSEELRNSADPEDSLRRYRRLRERCGEFDERLAHLAAEHPHIPATTVIEDFPDIRWTARTKPLLWKLEREEAWRQLDEILDDAILEEGIEELLDALERPGLHIERVIERIVAGDGHIPAWVWFSTIPTDHYDTFTHHVSWNRICGNADDATWEYFSGRAEEALGYDDERIATFEALAPEFHGTFQELIETALRI